MRLGSGGVGAVLRRSHVSGWRPDCVADDAVNCEPVSAPNSLLTGKITGNFAESGYPPRFSCLINARIQWLTAEFPAQRIREFFSKNRENLVKQQRGR